MEWLFFIKIFLLILFSSFLLIMIIDLSGRFFPKEFNYSASNSFFIPKASLFQYISNPVHEEEWRISLTKLELIDSEKLIWKEYYTRHDVLTFKGKKDPESYLFECRSIEQKPFQFDRSYHVKEQYKMTFLHINDSFVIQSSFLRLLFSFFYNHEAYLRKELKKLDLIFS